MRLKPSLLALLLLPALALAQVQIDAVTSKEREIQYAHETEQQPLGATSNAKRAAAFLYVQNDHTNHILVCGPLFQQLLANHAHYANAINSQMLISAGAYLYNHPESVADSERQMLAGLSAVLVVYEKFLAADPASRYAPLDHMIELRNAGKLEDALPATCRSAAP